MYLVYVCNEYSVFYRFFTKILRGGVCENFRNIYPISQMSVEGKVSCYLKMGGEEGGGLQLKMGQKII